MPKGPRGEKRPADVIGAAVMVAKIATGKITEELAKPSAAVELGRKGGAAGPLPASDLTGATHPISLKSSGAKHRPRAIGRRRTRR